MSQISNHQARPQPCTPEGAGGTSIREEVWNFIVANFLFGQDIPLADGESLLDKGIIDSTGVLELVAFLENRFGIRVQDGEITPENFDSVENLAGFIQRSGGSAGAK